MFGGRDFPAIHDRPPLLRFIRDRLDADRRLPDAVCTLPDEARGTPHDIVWGAGAFDGVMGHHAGRAGPATEAARQLANAIVAAAARPRRRQLTDLYAKASREDVLSFIDATLETLVGLRPPTADIARIATWLASESPDRGPVKVGIALLGVTGAPDGSLLHELGAHEEFTLFAVVAFTNSRQNADADIFELAKRVHGWGRIHCVERLRNTSDRRIAEWILNDGFRNSVMNEYLAYIAATTGDLADALREPTPNRELLTAAGDIIGALLAGGPAEDIDDYADAPTALSRWLDHMDHHAETLPDFLTISSIRDFCSQDDWDSRIARGDWTTGARDQIRAHAAALLAHARWPELVRAGLDARDPQQFWHAEQAARALGIDAFDQLLARIDADPLNGPWFQAWQGVDDARAQTLVDRATRLLDLAAIASGPSTAIGLGPEFRPHAALNWTLQALRNHPGLGTEIVTAAMQSPTIQNRNGALNVLEAWGSSHWNDQHRQQLERLAAADPDDKVRQRAGELIGPRGANP
jgi:hypothetical protein